MARLDLINGPTAVDGGWYTFQLTPLSSSNSGTVVHPQLPTAADASVPRLGVSRTGPPWVPEGSIIPDSQVSRLGMVGPISEQ